MKILFHINSMGHGGAERVVSILSRNFASQGHDVIVATQWCSEKEYALASTVRRISVGLTRDQEQKGRLYKAWCRLFNLRGLVRREKPDIVISFCAKANFRSAYSLMGMRIPLLVSVRNNPVEDYKPHKMATRYMERKAAGCVFQTPDAQAYFSKTLQDKSRIILNPLSEIYYKEENQRDVDSRRKVIVTVGRITSQKNQMLLLKAFDNIKEEYPDYNLEIYGDVESQEIYHTLQQYCKDSHLEGRVRFMGNTDDIPGAIRDAALFVLPSDYEGMPNALIEAMALGLPCISTDCPCGGSAMLIEQGKSGLLVPVGDEVALADAMREMLGDMDKSQNMGKVASGIKDKVNPQMICKQWMEYIEEITCTR